MATGTQTADTEREGLRFTVDDSERNVARLRQPAAERSGAHSTTQLELEIGRSETEAQVRGFLNLPTEATWESASTSGDSGNAVTLARAYDRQVIMLTANRDEPILSSARNKLVDKQFQIGLSDEEAKRLELIRWRLDQIEDAKYGKDLDEIEWLIEREEKLQADIEGWVKKIAEAGYGARGKSPSGRRQRKVKRS